MIKMELCRVDQELYDYLLQKMENEEAVNEKLKREHFPSYIAASGVDGRTGLLYKLRYRSICEELHAICEGLDRADIPFVVMKGITLANRLYAEPSYRLFEDIDILVDSMDLFSAIKTLEALGYQTESKTDEDAVRYYLEQTNRELHFSPFRKAGLGKIQFMVELHIDIVSPWMFGTKPQSTKGILSRRKLEEGIPVMDECDTLLFQALHILKHYMTGVVDGFVKGEFNGRANLKGIHELALLIDKYKDWVDREQFADRIREAGMEDETGLVLKWVREIYPSCREFCDIDLVGREKKEMTKRFCQAAMGFGIGDLAFRDSPEVAAELVQRIQKCAAVVECRRKADADREESEGQGWVSISRKELNGKQSGHKTFGNINRECGLDVRFRFLWDDEFLWFQSFVNHEGVVFDTYVDEETMCADDNQDFIRLHFDTKERSHGKAAAMGVVLKPQFEADGRLKVFIHKDIYENYGKEVIPETMCLGSIRMMEDGYFLEAAISWGAFPFFPEHGGEFFTDVLVGTEEAEMTWQNPSYYMWYNIAEYGRVLLS